MKFSIAWLKKWVTVELSNAELAEALTAGGLEVEQTEPVAAGFTSVIVSEITACAPHPDADKLQVCQVNTGADSVQIVCGAPNARVGLKAPLATVGARLPGDFRIKPASLRGIESQGMLCSARELGLSDDASGLMELPADAEAGLELGSYLQLEDEIIELNLTPNRADCLSIRGIARDVSAMLDTAFHDQPVAAVPATCDASQVVVLEDPEGCPRYAGRVIQNIDPTATTPLWISETLRRSGLRCIDPVVDVTNFVMLERGQPLHAFDADCLEGDIVVRRGQPGEKLLLLDGSTAELGPDFLLIADQGRALAVAGIMGGDATGVTSETRNIFLESAFFNPAVIMGKARRLGLHTDASHRFERGVDPAGQVEALERATELLLEICGGVAGPVTVRESLAHIPVNPVVELRLERLNRVLGSALTAADVTPVLQRLGLAVHGGGPRWEVSAPPSRFDVAIEEDLIEEVARIYGYNRLPIKMPEGELPTPDLPERVIPLERMCAVLCAAGYQEVINYSFIDARWLKLCQFDVDLYALANPLAADLDMMRPALLPGLLKSLAYNARRQKARLRLFETGTVFTATDAAPAESQRIAGVINGLALPEQWGVPSRPADFYDLKGDVSALLGLRGDQQASFVPHAAPWLHPGQAAALQISGQPAGWLGAVHPAVLQDCDIGGPVFAFELDVAVLAARNLPGARPVSKFPAIRRDLSLLVPESVNYLEIEACISETAGDLMTNLLLFDLYSGQNVEKGYKSLAMGLILQDVSSTLIDEDVNSLVQRVVSALETRFKAKLRG